MPREDVDRSALSVHRKRDLDADLPAPSDKHRDDRVDQPSMTFVEEAVELLAAPSDGHVEPGFKRRDDPGERIQR